MIRMKDFLAEVFDIIDEIEAGLDDNKTLLEKCKQCKNINTLAWKAKQNQ